jgi:hypothetical protein
VKRILQIAAVVQVLLCVWLVVRIADVVSMDPPAFPELKHSDAKLALPPLPARTRVPAAVIASITDDNLFELERGDRAPVDLAGLNGEIDIEEPPIPPPTTIELAGIILLPPDPIAIMSDSAAGADQRRLRAGDLIGDYEVGAIYADSVELKGAEGQSFNVSLQVRPGDSSGGQVAGPRPGQAARPTPARPGQPARPAATPAARAAAARPAGRPMTASERAAAMAGARRGKEIEQEEKRPNPVEARLEALRRLREAAKTR